MTTALAPYDAARQALAECTRIDIAKDVRDKAEALQTYARAAEDRELEANAVELRERATRRLGELIIDEKQSGRIREGNPNEGNRSAEEQLPRVKLAELGISRKLSMVAQRSARLPTPDFEARLEKMHQSVAGGRAPTDALRDQERDAYRENARNLAEQLSAFSASLDPDGRLLPVLYADPAWRRKAGFTDRSYENTFPTMTWDEIIGLGPAISARLLPDAWGFIWMPRAHVLALHPVEIDTPLGRTTVKMPLAWAVAQAWGFDSFSTLFVWTKTDEEHPEEHSMGLIAYDQDEVLLMFKRGKGLPMPTAAEKFGSNHRERAEPLLGRKPEFYRHMIEVMTGGLPVLELFARVDDEHPLPAGWEAWGNEARAVGTDEAPASALETAPAMPGEGTRAPIKTPPAPIVATSRFGRARADVLTDEERRRLKINDNETVDLDTGEITELGGGGAIAELREVESAEEEAAPPLSPPSDPGPQPAADEPTASSGQEEAGQGPRDAAPQSGSVPDEVLSASRPAIQGGAGEVPTQAPAPQPRNPHIHVGVFKDEELEIPAFLRRKSPEDTAKEPKR